MVDMFLAICNGIIFFALGMFYFLKPDLLWTLTEEWKSDRVQFTELSGRCSVFERPLSDAKRPLFF